MTTGRDGVTTHLVKAFTHLVLATKGNCDRGEAREAILRAPGIGSDQQRDLWVNLFDFEGSGEKARHLLSGHPVEGAIQAGATAGGDAGRSDGADVLGMGTGPHIGEVVLRRSQLQGSSEKRRQLPTSPTRGWSNG